MDHKEQKELFLKISGLVNQAGNEIGKYLVHPNDSTYLDTIKKIETQGDEVEEALNAHFSSQRNIPYLALDRAKLLRRLDEVLDQILLASRTLETYGHALPSSFSDEAQELSKMVDSMTSKLDEAIITMYSDFHEANVIVREIEKMRDMSTDLLFKLEKDFFQSDETSDDWKAFTAISRVARRTMSIINATKSASEVIEIMSMKYI